MPIAAIMTRKLITVDPNISVGEMQPMFKQHRIHHLLVIDNHKLVGVISDRDVLRNLSPFAQTSAAEDKDLFTLKRHAYQIMNKNIVSVSSDTSIRDACATILNSGMSLLPVIDNRKLVGVVSWRDILRHFLN